MQTLKYTPTQFDAAENYVSERIAEYITDIEYTVTRGESAAIIVDFETEINHKTLLLIDSAMISLGYYRK